MVYYRQQSSQVGAPDPAAKAEHVGHVHPRTLPTQGGAGTTAEVGPRVVEGWEAVQ